MKRQAPRWTKKHAFDVRRGLENHVLKDLGHLPVADIERQEVLVVLLHIKLQLVLKEINGIMLSLLEHLVQVQIFIIMEN